MQYAYSHYKPLYLKIFLRLSLKLIRVAVHICCYKILSKIQNQSNNHSSILLLSSLPCCSTRTILGGLWACSAYTLCACVYLVCIGGKGVMVSANFLYTEKICCWTDWGGQLTRLRANRYTTPSSNQPPPRPNVQTEKPAPQNCAAVFPWL